MKWYENLNTQNESPLFSYFYEELHSLVLLEIKKQELIFIS